jgi:hypothetical protein
MIGRLAATTALLVLLAGCGGSAPQRASSPDRASSPAHASSPDREAALAASHGGELVYLSRNVETGIPEDVYVYADGTVRYRYLLHTKITMRDRHTTLSAASMQRLHALLARTRLNDADRGGTKPPRGGYWYVLRTAGRTIATADGHLAPGVRPLITRLGRLEDRMLARGEDH